MRRSSRGSWVAGWLFRCLRGRRGSCRGWWVVQSSAAGETADRTAANHCRCIAWSRGWTTPIHTPTPHSRTHVHAHAYSDASSYYIAIMFMSITTTTGIQRVQALADILRSPLYAFAAYVVTTTKPVHRLQIRPIVHNWGHPLQFYEVTSGCVQ